MKRAVQMREIDGVSQEECDECKVKVAREKAKEKQP